MQIDLNQIFLIVSIIGIAVGSGLGILKIYYMREDRKPKFTYERLNGNNQWKIMILHPDKPIHKISIKLDNRPLPIANSNNKRYERTMRAGEGKILMLEKNLMIIRSL